MKLYSAPMPAPNPRRVRMAAAEKGIALDEVMLDLRQREHKAAEHLVRNPLGQVPVLELDDGTIISETVSICRYLDAIAGEPVLFGRDAREQALIDMWVRRVELQIGEPVKMFWRHAHPATAALLMQFKDYGASNRALLDHAMRWLDREIAEGRGFIAGDAFTMADIAAVTIVDFGTLIGMTPLEGREHAQAWHGRVAERPSYRA
ncbi:glutathione S-transferase family protein [Sphingomonas dokdonensis]|uniref:Glutathione S-transferase GstA n=1 Tax=Sphingomonas dokdonensis TaxID=344880 RepID=A0A245ZF81_9SPHN|nr:glutathione S-transferase family protein [Sphingomonas dokdonensis]OWK28379.1 glutathione S-transferase GstA [Sphingomonas dokdonensis]